VWEETRVPGGNPPVWLGREWSKYIELSEQSQCTDSGGGVYSLVPYKVVQGNELKQVRPP